MNSELLNYTQPTPTIDFDNPVVSEFIEENAGDSNDKRIQSINLYYAVRDGIRYNPYSIDLSVEGLRASTTLQEKRGWCVSKAVLFVGCCRAVGIPARLGFADVRNHLSTKRMREELKTDVFYWHGYASICLNGTWIKATPAFNIELCQRFRLKPLDFDGINDSIFHSFDLEGKEHMEYIRFRGEYPDVPIDQIRKTFRREYPSELSGNHADFDRDVDQEALEDSN